MRKSTLLMILLLTAALLLGGCQLAHEAPPADTPMLVGVLITSQDLQSAGRYSSDDAGVYAVIEEDGLVFPGVEGWYACCYTGADENGDPTSTFAADDALQMSGMSIHDSDEGRKQRFTATLTLAADPEQSEVRKSEYWYYINPIYQDSQGRILAVPGSTYYVWLNMEGNYSSTTLSSRSSVRANGMEHMLENSVEVIINLRRPLQETTLIEMSNDNLSLQSQTFAPGELTSYAPHKDCAYLLAQQTSMQNGVPVYQRILLEKDDQYLLDWVQGPDHVLIPRQVSIEWP